MNHHVLRRGVAALGVTALALVPAAGASAHQAGASSPASVSRQSQPAATLDPTTAQHLHDAMRGEAFAHASYHAYATQARTEGLTRVAQLYDRTAGVEFGDHFTAEAQLVGQVGSNAANLQDAISGENYETTTMYPGFAADAAAAGDSNAAETFTGIAADEATHRDYFRQALQAITDPSSGVTVPAGPQADPVTIPAGPAQVSAPTLANLQTAMHGEALAYAKYTLYAEHARATGQPALAALFERTSQVELTEHFAEEATLAGLVSDTRTNLSNSISGETYEATVMYPTYARDAAAVGDLEAARVLRHNGRDEAHHAATFARTLTALNS